MLLLAQRPSMLSLGSRQSREQGAGIAKYSRRPAPKEIHEERSSGAVGRVPWSCAILYFIWWGVGRSGPIYPIVGSLGGGCLAGWKGGGDCTAEASQTIL